MSVRTVTTEIRKDSSIHKPVVFNGFVTNISSFFRKIRTSNLFSKQANEVIAPKIFFDVNRLHDKNLEKRIEAWKELENCCYKNKNYADRYAWIIQPAFDDRVHQIRFIAAKIIVNCEDIFGNDNHCFCQTIIRAKEFLKTKE